MAATHSPRPELLLLAALLGACAVATATAQAPVVSWAAKLPGKWYGTCVQLAYSNKEGTEAMCLPGKLKMRYRITFEYTATTYNFTNVAGVVKYAGKTYGYAAYTSSVGNYTLTDNGQDTSCTKVKFEDGSSANFLGFVYHLGSSDYYVEEGIYTFDNTPKDVCLYNIGLGQRCVRSRKYYSYSCVAARVKE